MPAPEPKIIMQTRIADPDLRGAWFTNKAALLRRKGCTFMRASYDTEDEERIIIEGWKRHHTTRRGRLNRARSGGYRAPMLPARRGIRNMPIKTDRQHLYPGGGTNSKEWKEFRSSILERAGNACEGTPMFPACRAENGKPHPVTGSKVVLTIAHMDHDESHADADRCRALCQKCHLSWDAKHHAKNAAVTRRKKSPQLDIEDI